MKTCVHFSGYILQDETYEHDGLIGPAGNELMDEGNGDLSVCSKILLGWLSEDKIQVYTGGTQSFSLTSMQYSPSCIMIPKNLDDGYLSEYFLIEFIQKKKITQNQVEMVSVFFTF